MEKSWKGKIEDQLEELHLYFIEDATPLQGRTIT